MFTKTVILPVDIDEAFALITSRSGSVAGRRCRRASTCGSAATTAGPSPPATWRPAPSARSSPASGSCSAGAGKAAPTSAPDASTVSITVEPVEGGTAVTLTHEELTDEQAAMHAEGWNHYLGRLEKAAVAGDAGPDEWSAAPEQLDELAAADATLAVLQACCGN